MYRQKWLYSHESFQSQEMCLFFVSLFRGRPLFIWGRRGADFHEHFFLATLRTKFLFFYFSEAPWTEFFSPTLRMIFFLFFTTSPQMINGRPLIRSSHISACHISPFDWLAKSIFPFSRVVIYVSKLCKIYNADLVSD